MDNQDGTTEVVSMVASAGLVIGVVQTEARGGLPGARVTLKGHPGTEITSSTGKFLFENVTAGVYELRAQADGYQNGIAKLEITPGVIVRVVINMKPVDAASQESGLFGSGIRPQSIAPRLGSVEFPVAGLLGFGVLVAIGAAIWGGSLWRRRPSRLVLRGRRLALEGRVADAERLASRALARHPRDSDAWLLLGACLIKRGAYEKAAQHLEKASAIFDPQVAGIAFLITMAYNRMGRRDEARPWLHMVARDENYWAALDRQPEAALDGWLAKGRLRSKVDPAYA